MIEKHSEGEGVKHKPINTATDPYININDDTYQYWARCSYEIIRYGKTSTEQLIKLETLCRRQNDRVTYIETVKTI